MSSRWEYVLDRFRNQLTLESATALGGSPNAVVDHGEVNLRVERVEVTESSHRIVGDV